MHSVINKHISLRLPSLSHRFFLFSGFFFSFFLFLFLITVFRDLGLKKFGGGWGSVGWGWEWGAGEREAKRTEVTIFCKLVHPPSIFQPQWLPLRGVAVRGKLQEPSGRTIPFYSRISRPPVETINESWWAACWRWRGRPQRCLKRKQRGEKHGGDQSRAYWEDWLQVMIDGQWCWWRVRTGQCRLMKQTLADW